MTDSNPEVSFTGKLVWRGHTFTFEPVYGSNKDISHIYVSCPSLNVDSLRVMHEPSDPVWTWYVTRTGVGATTFEAAFDAHHCSELTRGDESRIREDATMSGASE